jgi:5-methylcytosine-specific restriction endonuclease McrA
MRLMPYKSNQYKNFIRSARWQRLRAQHLKRHPLCVRCHAKGKVTLATEVHHIVKCMDEPSLQMDPANLESLCAPCHAPLTHDDRRGYSKEIGIDGYPTDPRHPANRPRSTLGGV